MRADADEVSRVVQRLNYGLPAEDEFSVVCAWLGRCKLIHKLDQEQSPVASTEAFQVPDLLAMFEGADPCLIEVKSSTNNTLSLKPDYHARLRAYADALGMPLLIAWKRHGLWVLFDTSQLKLARTNYNVTFEHALRHNLMGVLAGDVSYVLKAGASVNFIFAKEELLSTEKTDAEMTETWRMRVSDAFVTDGTGARRSDLHSETFQLLGTWPLEENEVHGERTVEKKFFVGEQTAQFAHQALVGLLHWERIADDAINWRQLLRATEIAKTIANFRAALQRGLDESIVQYVFDQMPAEFPAFIHQRNQRNTAQSAD
jgi:Holliday junction resolvase